MLAMSLSKYSRWGIKPCFAELQITFVICPSVFFFVIFANTDDSKVDCHGSSKPGNRSFGYFSRPLLEVYFTIVFLLDLKVKSLAVAEISCYCKGFCLSHSYFCVLDQKYKRGAIAHILSGKSSAFVAEAIWAEKTLSDLCCEFRSGRNISASLIHETGDYPVYGGNGIRGYCDHYSHEGEYVVVGRQGALCGNVKLIQGKNYLSEHAIAVRANEENETKFLLYLLDYMKLGQYSDQGAQPGLAVNKLLRLKCTVPDKETQLKIASFLLSYDMQISDQERMLSLLIKQRKAYLQQLFI